MAVSLLRPMIGVLAFMATLGLAPPAAAQAPDAVVLVTPDNFVRAETDLYFSGVVKNGGFGKFDHTREPAPLDKQSVIRLNRDTLYSAAVFDLDAGPVSITMPEAAGRFMSLQVIDQDQYTYGVFYEPGEYRLTRDGVGTRYVVAAMRTLVDPSNPADSQQVHALQDKIQASQAAVGAFEVPKWDPASQKKVRDALLTLASTLPDTTRMYGRRGDVDPVRFVIGAAQGWGANPQSEALYLNIVPERNDGSTAYGLKVGEVPVDGFWSVSVYNEQGYFQPNTLNAYSLNNITAKPGADGYTSIQFGGCDSGVTNCLPIMKGWNYMVRLYRPRPEVLERRWTFPKAQALP